jgi:glycine/D-amino acid oxidase-like deaminating enzyme
MSLNGYGGAGGMGKLMAEWIVEGDSAWPIVPPVLDHYSN